jgi:serine/threonine-protein kinase/endoribonuclease IRE1
MPQNILFKRGGYEGTLKLTDFGLSQGLQTRDLNKSFTTTTAHPGTEIGSFGYYAPEVYRRGNLTSKVDVFSTGCCVFYVLSHGRRPFEEPNDPDNKYLLNVNIMIGKSSLVLIAPHPDAVELVGMMIDIEAKVRPSMEQVLEHPIFWSDETRFQFLCSVGKEADVRSSRAAARAVLPPSMLPSLLSKQLCCWSDAIDERVWVHYTNEAEQGRKYDTSSTTHLLRFLRNCEAHPPPHDSQAQAVLAAHGGMASYFVGSIPRLAHHASRSWYWG